MRTLRQIIAALALLAWLGAGAHMALAHGGLLLGWQVGEAMHEEAPAPVDGGHHHHEFDALTAAQFAKSLGKQFSAPQWDAADRFVAEFVARLRAVRAVRARPAWEDSPPDARASGWLLVCRTALPVRGPSFAA